MSAFFTGWPSRTCSYRWLAIEQDQSSFKEMTEGLDEITDEKNLHPLAVAIRILFYESVVWISCWISIISIHTYALKKWAKIELKQ